MDNILKEIKSMENVISSMCGVPKEMLESNRKTKAWDDVCIDPFDQKLITEKEYVSKYKHKLTRKQRRQARKATKQLMKIITNSNEALPETKTPIKNKLIFILSFVPYIGIFVFVWLLAEFTFEKLMKTFPTPRIFASEWFVWSMFVYHIFTFTSLYYFLSKLF